MPDPRLLRDSPDAAGDRTISVDRLGCHRGGNRRRRRPSRGRLRAITKRQAGSKKARRIARHNLGTKKQALRTLTGQAAKEIVYGEGNRTRVRGQVLQHPLLIVYEDLSHLRGKAKSKKLSRLCSAWMRSELEGRMMVHAYRGRSPMKAVNAAYTSQTCPKPECGYVSSTNRNGDRFHCRNPHWDCNWQGDADCHEPRFKGW